MGLLLGHAEVLNQHALGTVHQSQLSQLFFQPLILLLQRQHAAARCHGEAQRLVKQRLGHGLGQHLHPVFLHPGGHGISQLGLHQQQHPRDGLMRQGHGQLQAALVA